MSSTDIIAFIEWRIEEAEEDYLFHKSIDFNLADYLSGQLKESEETRVCFYHLSELKSLLTQIKAAE